MWHLVNFFEIFFLNAGHSRNYELYVKSIWKRFISIFYTKWTSKGRNADLVLGNSKLKVIFCLNIFHLHTADLSFHSSILIFRLSCTKTFLQKFLEIFMSALLFIPCTPNFEWQKFAVFNSKYKSYFVYYIAIFDCMFCCMETKKTLVF